MFKLVIFLLLVESALSCGAGGGGGASSGGSSSSSSSARRKRDTANDVISVIVSSKPFSPATHQKDMDTVQKDIHEFSSSSGLSFSTLNAIDREAENTQGKFGVRFRVVGEAEHCQRVTQFVQAAVNEIKDVTHGFVKCGNFDTIRLNKAN